MSLIADVLEELTCIPEVPHNVPLQRQSELGKMVCIHQLLELGLCLILAQMSLAGKYGIFLRKDTKELNSG